MQDIISTLRKKKNFHADEGISESEIRTMEDALWVKFPEQYQEFLKIHASMMWFGHIILGRCEGEADFDAVLHTEHARGRQLPAIFSPFPENAVVIEKYASGGYFVLYCKGHPEEGKVRLLDDHDEGAPTDTWASFEEYLRSLQ